MEEKEYVYAVVYTDGTYPTIQNVENLLNDGWVICKTDRLIGKYPGIIYTFRK